MNMIRHHDEVTEVVADRVEMKQAVGNDRADFRLSHHAGPKSFVERFHILTREGFMEFAAKWLRKR